MSVHAAVTLQYTLWHTGCVAIDMRQGSLCSLFNLCSIHVGRCMTVVSGVSCPFFFCENINDAYMIHVALDCRAGQMRRGVYRVAKPKLKSNMRQTIPCGGKCRAMDVEELTGDYDKIQSAGRVQLVTMNVACIRDMLGHAAKRMNVILTKLLVNKYIVVL